MSMTPRERELAIRAAQRLREMQRKEVICPMCHGQGQIESGTAIDGPESMGGGHACFAPCPECFGTGRGEGA